MNSLYLFNPDNDMALASFSPYYMAPGSAQKMAADLSALPAWFADNEGVTVLLADEKMYRWMQEVCRFQLPTIWTTKLSAIYNKVKPWGWNPSLCRHLAEAGLQDALPTSETLNRIRELSSRELSVEVLRSLHIQGTLGESHLFQREDAVLSFLSSHPKALLKAPWSGSGKGIRPVWTEPDASLLGWIRHTLHTQGGVVGEPFYDKVLDFAMEFKAGPAGVIMQGYSLFETDHRGAYKGNRLDSNEGIEQILRAYVPQEVLRQVCQSLTDELGKRLKGQYEGFLGVDMMICRCADSFAVHPCVEINLRMNMGIVARLFYDRYASPSSTGNYVVTFYSQPGESLGRHQELSDKYPLQLEKGRIRKGYLSLTPVLEDTRYQVYVVLD